MPKKIDTQDQLSYNIYFSIAMQEYAPLFMDSDEYEDYDPPIINPASILF